MLGGRAPGVPARRREPEVGRWRRSGVRDARRPSTRRRAARAPLQEAPREPAAASGLPSDPAGRAWSFVGFGPLGGQLASGWTAAGRSSYGDAVRVVVAVAKTGGRALKNLEGELGAVGTRQMSYWSVAGFGGVAQGCLYGCAARAVRAGKNTGER